MPTHAVLIINPQGNVLFSKYFHNPSLDRQKCIEENAFFEQCLVRHTSKSWTNKSLTQIPLTLAVNDIYVLMQRFGDLIVFVSGIDDIDEVVLGEILVAFQHILEDLCGGHKPTEQVFMNPENFGKWVIFVDEVIPQGILETTDPELILKLGKVRSG